MDRGRNRGYMYVSKVIIGRNQLAKKNVDKKLIKIKRSKRFSKYI